MAGHQYTCLLKICFNSWVLALLFCPAPGAGPSRLFAQETDQVHITPRAKPADEQRQPEQIQPADAPLEESSLHIRPFRVDVDLVLVPVSVIDPKNRPVLGLKKNDFRLFENEQPQDIQYFSAEDVPISVGVIMDLSKSMADKIEVAREALGQFFGTANPDDDYFVVTFADRPHLLADSTRSLSTIQARLADAQPQGHTALVDAVYLGLHHSRFARHKRRALLIISDGGDNHSRYRSNELEKLVQEADVEIYAIGIFGTVFRTPEEWAGKRLLTRITEATGGHTITITNPRELPQAAEAISAEMRSQYVLGYRPDKGVQNTKWRRIKIRLNTPAAQALQVYWKRGYLLPGE